MLQELEAKVNRWAGRKEQLEDNLKAARSKVESNKKKMNEVVIPVRDFLKEVLDKATSNGIDTLSGYMSMGLQDVFGEGYAIQLVEGGGESSRTLSIIEHRPDETSGDILKNSGGSSVELVSLIAQILAVWSWKKKIAQIVVTDESFSWFSSDVMGPIVTFLESLCEASGVQLILVTPDSSLSDHTDNTIKVKCKKGEATVV